ncbi:MAG: hypothetical protein ACREL7_13250 [Longimicrobiales bacterium]
MKRELSRGVALLAFLALARPAAGQSYLVDFGINGGLSLYTSMIGADEGFNGGSAKFGTSWLAGSQLTIWPWSRVGLRANFAYADRPLEADDELFSHVNLWAGSGDLLYRFKVPNETWQGPETLPYLALGLGEKWFNPAGDDFVCYDTSRNEYWSCVPFDRAPTAGSTFALGEWRESLMGLIGVGADFRVTPRWLFRVEVNDRIAKPQVFDVAGFLGGNIWDVPDGEENLSKWIHELGVQAGVHVALGLRDAVPVAAPPPPPQQPQQQQQQQQQQPPPPPPPPPPREDQISVCVVDPGAPNGMRMQSAVFRHANGDTVVVSGGQTTPLRQTVGNVPTAGQADWYVRGTPFVLTMGRAREEFVTYGQPTMMSSGVTYVGMANGYPVYANTSDVSAFQSQLATAVQAQNGDLGSALGGDAGLRTQFDRVMTIHVPMSVVGCRMQGLQRQEPVRKDDMR